MPYVTPIFDRVLSDVTGKTSKGYFNVADWTRVYGNSLFVRDYVVTAYGVSITFTTLTTPDTSTIPDVDVLNTLIQNIENIRLVSGLIGYPGVSVLKADWIAGAAASHPDFLNVNDWEQTIDVIYLSIQKAVVFQKKCGVSSSGQDAWRQNFFRRY